MSQLTTLHDDTTAALDNDADFAGRWAIVFRALNWFIGIAVAVLGALIAANFGEDIKGLLSKEAMGVYTAGLAAITKTIEPGERAARHTTRKRVIELIRARMKAGEIQELEMQELLVRAKIDPNAVLEDLLTT